jgi:tripartite-type tricarboxylate transporter receptor subunit TctC
MGTMSNVTLVVSVLAIVCSSIATLPSMAADYPERPVRVIVPSAPGGSPDVGARIIVAELTRQMGKQFIVDNRPGASGSIGTDMIARATPDGYTIGLGTFPTLITNRFFLTNLTYDVDRDIQPVVQIWVTSSLLAVALSLPVKSVQELIDHARKNPGRLLFASSGTGTSMHLSGELFKRMTGTEMTHVPYKATQQAITEIIGAQVHLMFDPVASIGPHVKAVRVRGLAVTSPRRSSAFPELPTVAESGVPKFEVSLVGGLVAPAGVSKTIVNRLNAEVNKALAISGMKEKIAAMGPEPGGGTPEEFAALIKRDVAKWAEVIKGANIKVD